MISINSRKINQVKKLLSQKNEDEGDGSYPSKEERTVGSARSAEAFMAWTENMTDIKCDLIDGDIVVRELTSSAHGHCQGVFIRMLGAQGLEATGPVTVTSRQNALNVREPDSLVPLEGVTTTLGGNAPGGDDYIAIVLEIACKQRPRDLHERGVWFLGPAVPCVQYYIGLKIYNERQDNSIAMVLALYTRANGGARPLEVISFGDVPLWHNCCFTQWIGDPRVIFRGLGFGDPPCAAAGMPRYIININTAYLYSTHALGVPAGAPAQYQLDLFHFRDRILRKRTDY